MFCPIKNEERRHRRTRDPAMHDLPPGVSFVTIGPQLTAPAGEVCHTFCCEPTDMRALATHNSVNFIFGKTSCARGTAEATQTRYTRKPVCQNGDSSVSEGFVRMRHCCFFDYPCLTAAMTGRHTSRLRHQCVAGPRGATRGPTPRSKAYSEGESRRLIDK